MAEYQVIARKYRPQSFKDVVGQEVLVSTLVNAIKFKRIAHAYLFCGSRGTGKTTIARVFAKAINCPYLSPDCEPCNECSSCKEVASGNSLDVIEIDGASNRGIDDIRQINETVGYSPATGKYRIYLIDEVHMLTKEAFNALLKTLEEPPATVKFFFATTEPHKVPATILSRCQRFQLNRIPTEKITHKLRMIAEDLSLSASDQALRLIANASEGSLRDAESLFDQIISFQGTSISLDGVVESLGLVPRESFFAFDQAFAAGSLSMAFELSHQVFSSGKDIAFFVENLIEHFRNLLLIKLEGLGGKFTTLAQEDRQGYEQSSSVYTQEQCLAILDILLESQSQIKSAPSLQIALEATLLRILRMRMRIPVEQLVDRLIQLELRISQHPSSQAHLPPPPAIMQQPIDQALLQHGEERKIGQSAPQQTAAKPPKEAPLKSSTQNPTSNPSPALSQTTPSISQSKPLPEKHAPKPPSQENQARYDTLMRFAAVELEGALKKK